MGNDRNSHKSRIKRSGQARLVYVKRHKPQHPHHVKESPRRPTVSIPCTKEEKETKRREKRLQWPEPTKADNTTRQTSYVQGIERRRPESPAITITWHASKYARYMICTTWLIAPAITPYDCLSVPVLRLTFNYLPCLPASCSFIFFHVLSVSALEQKCCNTTDSLEKKHIFGVLSTPVLP